MQQNVIRKELLRDKNDDENTSLKSLERKKERKSNIIK